jgi:CheY-like chemotaxis protein
MDRLPSSLKLSLAAWTGALILPGIAMAGAAFSGQSVLMALSAAVLLAVAVGAVRVTGRQIARHLHETVSRQEPPEQAGEVVPLEVPRFPVAREEPVPSPSGISGFSPDEQSLRRAHKLEAVERLRDGIVHDLNNKLMVISANIDAVARHMKEQPALQRKLLSALVASDQAGSLIARSTAFARQHQGPIRQVDLAERIDSIATLMGRSFLRDTVELRLDLAEDLWPVVVDQDELETAIVTLSAYVRDALTQGGTISLEARNVQVEKGSLSNLNLGGDFVQVVIGGSGTAEGSRGLVPEEERAFSLRDVDLSPWLTLSRSLQFLDPLGGAAEVRSTGNGPAIVLYLPRADAPASATSETEADEFDGRESVRCDTEILVVDDEVEVALALQSMLEEFGYIARIATNAGQVMKNLKVRKPDLVLTDVSMPGTMNGVMLAREIRQMVPGLPVLLITGNPLVTAEEAEYPLLHKPIVSRDLHAAIQRHLLSRDDNKVVPLFPRPSRRIS